MNSPYVGQIFMFSWDFAARNYALAQGQLMAINSNQALFSILGTYYGGNGMQTFALPDLRGRTYIGTGQGPGLSNYVIGEQVGAQQVTLLMNNMAQHNHPVNVNNGAATSGVPTNNYLSMGPVVSGTQSNTYSSSAANAQMNVSEIANNGSSLPVSIMQPYLTINFSIALFGIFPSRN
jgi:microcystin-dependent protein